VSARLPFILRDDLYTHLPNGRFSNCEFVKMSLVATADRLGLTMIDRETEQDLKLDINLYNNIEILKRQKFQREIYSC